MIGIIYKIECLITGECYYGSTKMTLKRRISKHKSQCKRWKAEKSPFTTSFQIIDRGFYSYSLLETVEYEDKMQLIQRERFHIENNVCGNHIVAGRTKKEYNEANKQAIVEQAKIYRDSHKKEIKEYHRQYEQSHKEQLKEKNKEYQQANKDVIREKKRIYYLNKKELLKNL